LLGGKSLRILGGDSNPMNQPTLLYINALVLPDKPRRFFVAELLFVHISLHFLNEILNELAK
jgi:hypothetical protein